jgi:hypothetical protein
VGIAYKGTLLLAWWLRPIIPAMQEEEMEESHFKAIPDKIIIETLSQ